MSQSPSIVYEVNLEVQKDIEKAYLEFLDEHIKEILLLEGFVDANLFMDVNSDDTTSRIVCQYRIKTSEDMDNYVKTYAPAMRAKAIELFGDKFKASRRILKLQQQFKP